MNDEVKLGGRGPEKCGECVYRERIPNVEKKVCHNPESLFFMERRRKGSVPCDKGRCESEATTDNGFSAEDKRIMNEGERDIRRIVASGEHDRTVFDLSEIKEGDVIKTTNKIFTCHESEELKSCAKCCFSLWKLHNDDAVMSVIPSNLCYMCSEGTPIYFTQENRPEALHKMSKEANKIG